jgi:hypothetical protein
MQSVHRTRSLWLAMAVLCLVAFACFAVPMYVIRPFRAQGAQELAIALSFRSWGPWVALACGAGSLAVLAMLWRRSSGRPVLAKIGASVIALLTVAFAALNQVNVFEKMFHPVPNPGFLAAGEAKVDADDMVLAINVSGEQRAYPIRIMGYHHIVNDRLGGTPVVTTY